MVEGGGGKAEEEVGQLGVEGPPHPVSLSLWEPLASRRVATTLCEMDDSNRVPVPRPAHRLPQGPARFFHGKSSNTLTYEEMPNMVAKVSSDLHFTR